MEVVIVLRGLDALFLDGWIGISRLFILSGLGLAIVNGLRFLADRPSAAFPVIAAPSAAARASAARYFHGGYASLGWPLLLVWLGFWVGTHLRTTPWELIAGLPIAVLAVLGIRVLRTAHAKRGDEFIAGPAVAVLLAMLTLVQFGLLLVVRLVVVSQPDDGLEAGLSAEHAADGLRTVVLPAATLLIAVAVTILAQRRGTEFAPGVRLRFARIKAILFDRPRTWARQFSPDARYIAAIGFVFLLYAAPLLDDGMVIGGVATPEYGKIVYFAVLALVMAEYAHLFRARSSRQPGWREFLRARRHIAYPIALFCAVGVASVLKLDMGPTIPVFAGTAVVMLYVIAIQSGRAQNVADQHGIRRAFAWLRDATRSARPLLPIAIVVLIGIAIMFLTPYISVRAEVWKDPWKFNWSPPCSAPPATAVVPPTPPGTEACIETLIGYSASNRSQIAHSLSDVADGGLWGRGLTDTTSGRLPAGSTDFIFAVIWSKLGGIVVAMLGAVLAILAAGLARLGRYLSTDEDAESSSRLRADRLFVLGVVGAIVGQFLFVLAATLNVVPHSGITAPFLSRGAQSTMALSLGVFLAMVWQYAASAPRVRTDRPTAAATDKTSGTPPWLLRQWIPAGAFALACFMLTANITLNPYSGYDESRPFCSSTDPIVDPELCSTDRIAYARTTVELKIDGVPQYLHDRSAMRWEPIGRPMLTPAQMGGLIQVGNIAGALEPTLGETLGTSLRARVLPPSMSEAEPGVIDLSVNPEIQRTAATALNADANGAGPLAGGVVVIDAANGHILSASSAPGVDAPVQSVAPIDDDVKAEFAEDHSWGQMTAGGIDESGPDCSLTGIDREQCGRWILQPVPAREAAADTRRFVENDPVVDQPQPKVNRAFDTTYGLGSAFEVVVAAAYLTEPNTSASDLIPAPESVDLGYDQVIYNEDGAECAGTVDGELSLTDALAVSCNTAFVALSQQIGWPKIRDTARSLGFEPSSAPEGTPAWLAGVTIGSGSRVPEGPENAGLVSNVFAGGEVVGTPLQMATVMAAIANGGTVIQPTLITSTTAAGGGPTKTIWGQSRSVLTRDQAGELRQALSATTGENGTAAALDAGGDRQLWVKTGTYDVVDGDLPSPPGQFTRQITWLVGFLDTQAGPVSFAVAVESRDEASGADRVRWVAQQVIDAIVKERG
ncbi:penicillin-binding transpeptidase domain-containing protein [Antrihabitans sp. YC2-6]|uniref:penicillin-binding transpeptidase domain-containing protein n=1 Tax=Antrihabitans sp. YC2-6 TaxID=2799498 RepID=UPI0018F70BC3|nr:penicillin-binding transpeptidase domain-containing protein [Antrihabitans sp. YC2-6]